MGKKKDAAKTSAKAHKAAKDQVEKKNQLTEKEIAKAAKKMAKKQAKLDKEKAADDPKITPPSEDVMPAPKGKKDKKKKAGNTEPAPDLPVIGIHLLEGVTAAATVKTLEDVARQLTTPSGDYTIETGAGIITLTKGNSATPGKEKLYWKLDGEKITRPALYQIVKESAPLKGTKTLPTGAAAGDDDGEKETGPSQKVLAGVYKKKQLMNALKTTQIFPKKVMKAIKQDMTEKTQTGSLFISTMMDASADELTLDMINRVFNELTK